MTEVERFVKDLRKLADRDMPILIVLPPNTVGLPEGAFVPKFLLNYIADSLDGKID